MLKRLKYASTSMVLSIVFVMMGCTDSYSSKYDWNQHYRYYAQQPYDLSLLYELFGEHEGGSHIITNNFYQIVSLKGPSNLVFVGEDAEHNEEQITALLDYVRRGSTVILSTDVFPALLQRIGLQFNLYQYNQSNYYKDTIQAAALDSTKSYPFYFQNVTEVKIVDWNFYFHKETLPYLTDSFECIGTIDQRMVNAVKVQLGEGTMVFHANPLLFTNFHLSRKDGYDYANEIFQYLNSGPIYWDKSASYQQTAGSDHGNTMNPLRLIFSEQSFRWAWYVLLSAILLYILFAAKRKQRIIPVQEKLVNSSAELVRNVALLYFKRGTYQNMVQLMKNLYDTELNTRYGINPSEDDEKQMQKVAQYSGIPLKRMQTLYEELDRTNRELSNAKHLIRLHKQLTYFYKNRK